MTLRKLAVFVSIAALSLVQACSNSPRRNEVSNPSPAYSYGNTAMYGRVTNIEMLSRDSQSSGAGGAIIGAVVGAAIGNQVGSGTGRAAATGVGAVGGALIGQSIDKRNDVGSDVYRVNVRLDNGAMQQFKYARIDNLRVGDRVRLEAGQLYRD